jgi:hypothetical protein
MSIGDKRLDMPENEKEIEDILKLFELCPEDSIYDIACGLAEVNNKLYNKTHYSGDITGNAEHDTKTVRDKW